jgi:hypothetical protein
MDREQVNWLTVSQKGPLFNCLGYNSLGFGVTIVAEKEEKALVLACGLQVIGYFMLMPVFLSAEINAKNGKCSGREDFIFAFYPLEMASAKSAFVSACPSYRRIEGGQSKRQRGMTGKFLKRLGNNRNRKVQIRNTREKFWEIVSFDQHGTPINRRQSGEEEANARISRVLAESTSRHKTLVNPSRSIVP